MGHEVILICGIRSGQPGHERVDGVSIYRQPMALAGQKAPIKTASRLRFLAELKPDVVLERYITLGGTGALLSKYYGIPLVLEVNSPHVEEVIHRWHVPGFLQLPLLAWRDFQFRWASLSFAPITNIVPPWFIERSRKMLWGVDTSRFRPGLADSVQAQELVHRYHLANRKVLLFVGSFLPWQGATHLPAILNRVKERFPDVLLLAVGKGWESGDVVDAIRSLGLTDNFVHTGHIPHKDIPYLCNLAQVGLAPFDVGGYSPLVRFGFFWAPSKVLEYLASGLPVVASDYPLLRELLGEGKHGAITPPGNDEAFTDAVCAMLSDPQEAKNKGKAGREYAVRCLDWKEHASIIEQYLREGIRLGAWTRGKH